MNHPDTRFDRDARDCHAQALDHVSPQIRARLREARRAALAPTPTPHRFGWLLAGGTAAAALALMLASQLQTMTSDTVPTPRMASTDDAVAAPALDPLERASQRAEIDSEIDGMLAALDENPDLYLWLAANDDALPPPSEY
ncbi:hypothetical protein [Lysobacter sp. F6437]|uniref:hypothetical protein n=1 Tax=Lysobacter sp. F6437 TaxID=3459296 RepID=UPI00403D6070